MSDSKIRSARTDDLVSAIIALESPEECYAFLLDICTVNELLSISQRWEVARMLDREITYNKISAFGGDYCLATISRVNRCLNYGEGGYRMMLDRMGNEKPYTDSN